MLKLFINASLVVLLLSASTDAIAQRSSNNSAVGGDIGLQQVPTRPERTAQATNSDIAQPIVVSQGTDVATVFDWVAKNEGFQRGPEWKTADETSLIFYVPHDNLRFRIDFSSKTEAIERMMVGFGDAGPCELQIAKLSLHPDTSYSIAMLPLHQRPYKVRPRKGESISPLIPQARQTGTESSVPLPSIPQPTNIDPFR